MSRLRFLAASLLFALAGAALELVLVFRERPWPPALAGRAALETALLWSAPTFLFALVVLLLARGRPARGAGALAPLAFGVAWLLATLDPDGRLATVAITVVALLAAAGAVALQQLLCRARAARRVVGTPRTAVVALALAAAAAYVAYRRAAPAPPGRLAGRPADVILLSIDTLRADRVGAYGGKQGLTPHLDALAAESVLFEDATCPMPQTAPSHVAMLTGLAPHESGVRWNGQDLARAIPALPDQLAALGWLTAGFVSGLPLTDAALDVAHRFHRFDDELDPDAPLSSPVRERPFGRVVLRALRGPLHWREPLRRDGRDTLARASRWLQEVPATTPVFCFVHLYDVHAPYVPRRPGVAPTRFFDPMSAAERVALLQEPAEQRRLIELYDGGVAYVDALVGTFLDELRADGRLESSVLVVTSDHGESLGEHELWADHVSPHRVETHVPLLIRLPGARRGGARIGGPVTLADLPATLADLLDAPLALPGESLAPAIEAGAAPPRLLFLAGPSDPTTGFLSVAVRDGRFKLLRRSAAFERASSRLEPAEEHLFDTRNDPLETRDLLSGKDAPPNLAAWRAALDAFSAALERAPNGVVAPGLLEPLRRLGYAK